MYTKEQIIGEIKRVAEKMGVESLDQEDFEKNSTIPMNTLRYYLGTWKQAVEEAGLTESGLVEKKDKAEEEELLLELVRLFKETGETPTLALIKSKSTYSERLFTNRWKSINDAFLAARKKFPHKFATPGGTIPDEGEDLGEQRIDELLDREKTDEIQKGGVTEEPIDFDELIKQRSDMEAAARADKEKRAGSGRTPDDIDPNEITSVHMREGGASIGEPGTIDFSDLGFDRMTGADEEERKETRAEEEEADMRTVEYRPPKPDEVIKSKEIKYIPQTIKPKKHRKKEKFVGELLNFRGLRFAPLNYQGVLFLFGMICHELGFLIEFIRSGFPTAEGKRCVDKENNHWEHVKIEFEYKSSHFRARGRDDNECDLIVCWIHDWPDCPLEVLELRSTINYLDNQKEI